MLKKGIILLIISCFLLYSCSVPDKNSPMSYFYIRFAKGIERYVLYNTEKSVYEIPSYISFKNEIKSQYPEINPVSTLKYYVNYSNPFELYINISLLNKNIKEIKFLNCNLILSDKVINLFETEVKNMYFSELIKYNDNGIEGRNYKGDFNNENKFIINNTDEYYFIGFTLGFKEILFDYNLNEEIIIKYNINVKDEKNNISEYKIEIKFERSYAEKKYKNKDIIWEKISYEEWRKYL